LSTGIVTKARHRVKSSFCEKYPDRLSGGRHREKGDEKMDSQRYQAEDLVQFGKNVLIKIGFPKKQAYAAAKILVEADLRGDHAHGITGVKSLDDIIANLYDDEGQSEFARTQIADFTADKQKYATILSFDAHGTLGHYVALEIIPQLIHTANKFGYAKAYIRNSTHFGNCGIYSEMIASHDLAAKVTCTSPPYTKPFIELQDMDNEQSPANRERYDGVQKRLGTNPIAWTIPYQNGMVTIDMAATQRAVSPALEAAKFNAKLLGIIKDADGMFTIPLGNQKRKLSEVHLSVARSETQKEALRKLGSVKSIKLRAVEKGLLKGPEGENINFPLAFDEIFKTQFWVAPLGGTYFGYKGFGLNLLIELDNVIGGGAPGLIRILDSEGKRTTLERVSQTLEAYAIDIVVPLEEAKIRLKEAVDTTLRCGNRLMYLPGQKEQETRKEYLAHGIPMTAERITRLRSVAADKRVGIPFDLE
jgi:LDH2 family malate/lactate/ureidoglycolate dehydrogenase